MGTGLMLPRIIESRSTKINCVASPNANGVASLRNAENAQGNNPVDANLLALWMFCIVPLSGTVRGGEFSGPLSSTHIDWS